MAEKKKIKKPNKKIRRIRNIILAILVIAIAGGLFIMIKDYSTDKIIVKGNETYSDGEIIEAVTKKDYVPNTLVMSVINKVFGMKYLPFLEEVTMDHSETHVLKIEVKEKLRAGVFIEDDKYVYFDAEGRALEKRYHLFGGVPVISGMEFEKAELGEKLKGKDGSLDNLLYITDRIAGYNLDIKGITFKGENDITLQSGKYKIYLGTTDYLNSKMSKIPEVLNALGKDHRSGNVDMSLFTDENNLITYNK